MDVEKKIVFNLSHLFLKDLGHFGVNICLFVHDPYNMASWLIMEATISCRENKIHFFISTSQYYNLSSETSQKINSGRKLSLWLPNVSS